MASEIDFRLSFSNKNSINLTRPELWNVFDGSFTREIKPLLPGHFNYLINKIRNAGVQALVGGGLSEKVRKSGINDIRLADALNKNIILQKVAAEEKIPHQQVTRAFSRLNFYSDPLGLRDLYYLYPHSFNFQMPSGGSEHLLVPDDKRVPIRDIAWFPVKLKEDEAPLPKSNLWFRLADYLQLDPDPRRRMELEELRHLIKPYEIFPFGFGKQLLNFRVNDPFIPLPSGYSFGGRLTIQTAAVILRQRERSFNKAFLIYDLDIALGRESLAYLYNQLKQNK